MVLATQQQSVKFKDIGCHEQEETNSNVGLIAGVWAGSSTDSIITNSC